MYNAESFAKLGLETKPSTSTLVDVKVTINTNMVEDYSEAYLREMFRTNPLKADKCGVTVEQLQQYFLSLLSIRVKSLAPGGYKDWRRAKRLAIPAWIQFILTTVGIVTDHIYGYRFVPEFEYDIKWEDIEPISEIIDSFSNDGLAADKDAFPRRPEGDKDVMSFTVIGEYVKGRRGDLAPIAAYAAAFLGLKLKQETEFKLLYSVTYEDVNFIRSQLAHERSILCINS